MLKVNNRSTITRCEICSKLTIKTPETTPGVVSGVFIVNIKHISHLVLVNNRIETLVYNRNTRKRCDICSELIIKTPERCQ